MSNDTKDYTTIKIYLRNHLYLKIWCHQTYVNSIRWKVWTLEDEPKSFNYFSDRKDEHLMAL